MVGNGQAGEWRAGAFVYSGRRDPAWQVLPAAAAACVRAFESLEPTRAAAPDQARLGYRGVWLVSPGGQRWDVFNGVAWSAEDRRLDVDRRIERALLESAPAGLLPSDWRNWVTLEAG